MILDPLKTVLLWIFIVFYSSTLLIAWRLFKRSKKGRERSISHLFWLNLMFFYSGLIAVYLISAEWEPDFIEFITVHSLITIGSYVAVIEVPGFLILSRYDEKSVEVLRMAKEHLATSTFDFETSIQELGALVNAQKLRLEEQHLSTSLEYFVRSSDAMKQANRSVLNLLLLEIGQSMRSISEKSKHPFPKLIDVFSLAGLSFLIAQFLK